MTPIEDALEILTGHTLNIDKVTLPSYQTPEMLLISKEAFTCLSDEARDLMNLITTAPDRLYQYNGQLKKISFQKYCKRRKGWHAKKVEELKFELALFCKFALLQ
jgi:hypothetical protein